MHPLQVVGKRLEIGRQHHKFGATVHLVGSRLIFFRQRVDIRHGERVADSELRIEVMNALSHHLRAALAIALWLQTSGIDAVLNEVVHHRLCAALTQFLIVSLCADAVGVCSHFNGHIGVFHQGGHHRVECRFRFGAECGFVEVVEYVFYHLRFVHCRQNEIHAIFRVFFRHVAFKFLSAIEVAGGAGKHGIAHAALEVEAKTPVGIGGSFLDAAIVAHDADNGAGHRFFVFVVYITRYPHFEVGFFKTVDMVVASAVFAIAAKVARFAFAESDAEIIVGRIHGRAHIFDKPPARRLKRGAE